MGATYMVHAKPNPTQFSEVNLDIVTPTIIKCSDNSYYSFT